MRAFSGSQTKHGTPRPPVCMLLNSLFCVATDADPAPLDSTVPDQATKVAGQVFHTFFHNQLAKRQQPPERKTAPPRGEGLLAHPMIRSTASEARWAPAPTEPAQGPVRYRISRYTP